MDKIQQEFEVWAIEHHFSTTKKQDGVSYAHDSTMCSFEGWKASRAALRVELPDGSYCGFEGDSFHAYMCGVESCKDILDEAGVSCK